MTRPKRLAYSPVAGGANTIAASQTPLAAGNLTLNGALASGGVIPQQTLAYIVSQTSVGADQGRTLTITGTNADGVAQTEDLTAAGAGLTVVSTKLYRSISSIAVDAATADAITVGTPNTTLCAVSPTYPLNMYTEITRLAMDVSGTINVGTEVAFERPNDATAPTLNWVAAGISAGTADANGTAPSGAGAVRLKINSYTNAATVALQVTQVSPQRS